MKTHPLVVPFSLLLGAGALLFTACGDGAPPHGEPAPEVTVRAPLAQASRVDIPRRLEIYGTIEADRTAAVSSRVMAQVTAVRAQAGDRVRRGQVLVEIDPQAARGQEAQARGALAQAEAALALAERNYQRFEALAQANAASELEVDQARTAYNQAQGAVRQAQGAVQAASAVASDSRVTAPFDGQVVRKMVEVGDLAAPGRPLLLLQSDASRRLLLPVPESAVAASGLAVGSELAVRLDAQPSLGTLRGAVVEMSPGPDPMTHSYQVKVELPREDLPTGAAARATLELATRTAVAVPRRALLRQGGLSLVVIRDGEGRARSRVVTLGEDLDDGRVEVLSGLGGDETLLLDLALAPASGARVEEAPGNEAERTAS
jgi:RND family efflux transporter MFP subunit